MNPSDFPEFAIPFSNAHAQENEPRYTQPQEGPLMYVVTRECSPEWESTPYREADLTNRLRVTKGQLSGMRANLKTAVEEIKSRACEYGTGNAVVYALATLGQTIDWIDMLSGPAYLDVPNPEQEGGENDGAD